MDADRLLTLFGRVEAPAGRGRTPRGLVRALSIEVQAYGFAFPETDLALLARIPAAAFPAWRTGLLDRLARATGAEGVHRTLFRKFPYETPEDERYLVRRVVGMMQQLLRTNVEDARVLECGHVVDASLFPDEDFGACPICQFAGTEAFAPAPARHAFRGGARPRALRVLGPGGAEALGAELVRRPASLSADERAFALSLRGRAIAPPPAGAPLHREAWPLVLLLCGEAAARERLTGATDVLRAAVLLSDPAADLSLAAPARFSIRRGDRGRLLRLLDAAPDLEEAMLRRRERWLRLGEHLHAGDAWTRRHAPRAAAAFDALRRAPEGIATFGRAVARAERARDLGAGTVALLARRPGELLRRADLLLRAGDTAAALSALPAAAAAAPRLGMVAWKALGARTLPGPRVAIPKGQANRATVLEERRAPIPAETLAEARAALEGGLARALSALPPLGRVWLDPGLADLVVPFNRRGDSSGLGSMTKGSRIPVGGFPVVRLFVHWTGNVDVDLSALLLDAKMASMGHVSWTRLAHGRGRGLPMVVHSGDVQSAPAGASEFIDVDLAALEAAGVAYVGASLISFRGERFGTFPCFAGWMGRDAQRSGEVFEPASVRASLDVASGGTGHLPLVLDVRRRAVVAADLAYGRGRGRSIEGGEAFRAQFAAALSQPERRLTALDVWRLHVAARGVEAASPEEADLVVEAEGLDWERLQRMGAGEAA